MMVKIHVNRKDMENIWGEIRNDFEIDDITTIDAWLTDDDNEEGTVIATVNRATGEIIYNDDRAKTDPLAQELIREVMVEELNNRVMEEIKAGIEIGDVDAIDELLTFVPKTNLIQFLAEGEWEKFKDI